MHSVLNRYIENLVVLPGDTEEQIQQKKDFFISSLSVSGTVALLTLFTWAFHLPVLATYGLGLVVFALVLFAVFLKIKRVSQWFYIANQFFILLFTCFTILRLGGIVYSGGLIFAQLAAVVYSLSLSTKKLAWWSFSLFVGVTVLEAVLQPYLTPAAEMTPVVNLTFFVINASWISLFMLLIVFYVFQQRAELEKAKSGRLQELDDLKTRMFANIAHEFRTPLTLIGGMAELMRENPGIQHRERTEIIQNNANKVLRLVDQMLNLARLEAGTIPLHTAQSDVTAFLRYLCSAFKGLAEYRQLRLHFLPEDASFLMDFDAEKLEDLVGNLLSNALKYTPAGGDVYLSIHATKSSPEQLIIRVKDTGIGIPADKQGYIFDRFYRVEGEQKRYEEGSGIGLTIVREYAKLMGGNISVQSRPGEGAEFTVTLPVTRNAPLQKSPETLIAVQPYLQPPDFEWSSPGNEASALPYLLIIEDNPEVTHYLQLVLGQKFRLFSAANGDDGIRLALEQVPDLILSDVMMPGKDGYEVCRTLKKDFRTCHIPIVLLTARADAASRLIGIEQGADAYLTKPFEKRELLACLRNLFIQREKMRLKFSSRTADTESGPTAGLDELFIKNVQSILEKNFSDDAFGIAELYNAMRISRVQLHRKLMALTGQSASHFIRSFRLEKARDLLRKTTRSVSEIAYETGFSDPNYFSRVFTQEYGEPPSDWRK